MPVKTARRVKTKKVVINTCYGGFGLSEKAYEKLIGWGVPVKKYVKQERDDKTGLYKPQPLNDSEVIFDNELTLLGEDSLNDLYWKYKHVSGVRGRYWDTWTRESREHPLIVRLVEELGKDANGQCSDLSVVEIPADAEYEISEYDGNEHVAETHRTWR